MRLTIFGKIALIILLVQAIHAAVLFFHTIPHIRAQQYRSERIVGIEMVNKIEALIKQFAEQLKQYEQDAYDHRKNRIREIVDGYAKSIQAQLETVQADKKLYEIVKTQILAATRGFLYGKEDYLYIVNSNGDMLSHPDPRLHGTNQFDLMDANGFFFVRELAKRATEQNSGYLVYRWRRLGGDTPAEKIAYYHRIPELDWIIATGVYTDDIKDEVQSRRELFIDMLSFTVSKATIGKTGYMYVFNEDCVMLIHPSMPIGTDFSDQPNPGASDSICRDLKDSIAKSDGELFYKWDHPSDRGNYVYDKVSWVRYNEDFKLYLASSAYMSELNESSENIKRTLLATVVIVFAVSSLVAFVFVRLWILLPIRTLSRAAREVQNGNLAVRSNLASRDELGQFSRVFDAMIDQVREMI